MVLSHSWISRMEDVFKKGQVLAGIGDVQVQIYEKHRIWYRLRLEGLT